MKVPVVLNKADLDSKVWEKLREHYEERLDDLRKKNDADMSETKTAALRGQIQEIKRLLNFDPETRKPAGEI